MRTRKTGVTKLNSTFCLRSLKEIQVITILPNKANESADHSSIFDPCYNPSTNLLPFKTTIQILFTKQTVCFSKLNLQMKPSS